VVAPVEQLLRDTRFLLIVPDGTLAGVPFAILRDGHGGRLVERFTIAYMPTSAAIVRRNARSVITSASHAVLLSGASREGDDTAALMEADREVEDLARLYSNRQVFRENHATPDEFLAAIVHAAVIHFAGHAVTNAKQPMRSALLLSPRLNGATPRYLYASQIAATNLHGCRLVVLAGCATGKRDGASRALGSLAQAFLLAGAESVVGTLWAVDDGVSRYTSRRVHELILGGASSAEAVRTLQLEMMTSTEPKLRAADAWASLTVLGGCDGVTSAAARS
jgi:CHAT domain-containing protein